MLLTIKDIRNALKGPARPPMQHVVQHLANGASPGDTILRILAYGAENTDAENDGGPASNEEFPSGSPVLLRSDAAYNVIIGMNAEYYVQDILNGIILWLDHCNSLSDDELFRRFMMNFQENPTVEGNDLNRYANLNIQYLTFLGSHLNKVSGIIRCIYGGNLPDVGIGERLKTALRKTTVLHQKLMMVLYRNANANIGLEQRTNLPRDLLQLILEYGGYDQLAGQLPVPPQPPTQAGPAPSSHEEKREN
ncbi:hypothetical protein GUA87_11735 [Sneathiella sp. P13V-1]|uniref:hypothetical protein n=1 Tax=Sneathiella sp. P13V-1 TaxID=2697366 RepID=UPI00187BAE52|nr:hypothetical protein [Sneathiella sp. P13V-1]MBE7637518.1 hypothetical protein [Sneathiella sp. P13V-1]